MYETPDSIPLRDWITIGVVFLALIIVIVLGVTFAEGGGSSNNVQAISGQLVTAPVIATPAPKNGQEQPTQQEQQQQSGQQPGGKVTTARDQKNINQMSFLQTFLLLLLVAAVFTVLASVLIALLVIQITSVIRRLQKRPDNNPPSQ